MTKKFDKTLELIRGIDYFDVPPDPTASPLANLLKKLGDSQIAALTLGAILVLVIVQGLEINRVKSETRPSEIQKIEKFPFLKE